MTQPRRTWRGRKIAPQTPREAWMAFWRQIGAGAALVAMALGMVMIFIAGDVHLIWLRVLEMIWVVLGVLVLVVVGLGYEIWLLRDRLAAMRRGDIWVDSDEIHPDSLPESARQPRKRRPTKSQQRRYKDLRRERLIITGIWLFCTVLVAALSVHEWRIGSPSLGQTLALLGGLVLAYVGLLAVWAWQRRNIDEGRK